MNNFKSFLENLAKFPKQNPFFGPLKALHSSQSYSYFNTFTPKNEKIYDLPLVCHFDPNFTF